ncbi:amino acid/amide ABC transporter membrane protein 2, HAAT family [Variovorax sp. YR266]|uniref:branched-chain amino acid ABC transporter permease n=1 Tax=Variovorax sp. YR266 TaxID=1884386 RepID=UPI000896D953|nr:branched-chain amino acid ABC transporter permease [Variovorax sp. YR266]SDZ70368.1 amino acid/amide ABC transporter membrane protein 2, HAAT family [Variovorax sp. YR266]
MSIDNHAAAQPFAPPFSRPLSEATRIRTVALVILVAALVLAPFAIHPAFLMKAMCFAIFACAFNLLLGYVGLLSFGHAAFFGMASYVAAHAAKSWGLTPELAILLGTLAAAAMGAVFGFIAIRRQGIYFATITLALAQLVYFICAQAPALTGGEDGIRSVPRGALFGFIDLKSDVAMYGVVAVVFVASMMFLFRVIDSPFGQVMRAIRDNEARAVSLGYRVSHYKLIAFTLSAALAGLAGALKAVVAQVASLTDVYWAMSGEPIVMTLIGGLGTVMGPALGAVVFMALQTYLSGLRSWVVFVQGAVFFICVLFFRQGVMGLLPARLRKWL